MVLTRTQIDNLIKKHSTTGAVHPSVCCRFCGRPVEPGTGEPIEAVLTKRKTLIVFHSECYRKEFLVK